MSEIKCQHDTEMQPRLHHTHRHRENERGRGREGGRKGGAAGRLAGPTASQVGSQKTKSLKCANVVSFSSGRVDTGKGETGEREHGSVARIRR